MIAALAFLRSAWSLAKLVPWWVYVAAFLVLYHIAAVQMSASRATSECNKKWEKQLAQQKAEYDTQVATLKAKQQEVITRTVIEYRDRVQIVKEKGDEIIKEVEVLVPVGESPMLDGGVRVIHDAAASGELPEDPPGAARAAPPVETSTVLRTVAENYESCRATREKLLSLQGLVSSLSQ